MRLFTDPDLEKIAAYCEAATPGPWEYDATLVGPGLYEVDLKGPTDEDWYTVKSSRPDVDSVFISSARSDLPALVAYARELRRVLPNLLRDDPTMCSQDEWIASQAARRLLGSEG